MGTPRGNGPSEARTEDHASSQGHPGTTDDAPGGGRASTDEGGAADGKGKNVAPGRNDAPGKNGAPAKNDPSDKKAPSDKEAPSDRNDSPRTSVATGAGGGGLIAGQALLVTFQEACLTWQSAGGSSGTAAPVPQLAVLLADGLDPAAVDRFCADVVAKG